MLDSVVEARNCGLVNSVALSLRRRCAFSFRAMTSHFLQSIEVDSCLAEFIGEAVCERQGGVECGVAFAYASHAARRLPLP
jgi:hypothetical protein